MIRSTSLLLRTVLAGAALALALGAQDTTLVLKGARIHPGGGTAIENGVVVLAGGKVQSVGGANTPVPSGAQVVDVAGSVITPGLIDAGAHFGVSNNDRNEQGEEVTPHMRILDAIDPTDHGFERARRHGVTTVQITPGNRNVIGGLGAVLKTAGDTVAKMLVKNESSLRLTMGSEPSSGNRAIRGGTPASMYYRRPTSRMGVVWAAREAFFDAQEYARRTIDPESAPPIDPAMEILVRVLQKQLVVQTTARSEQDIRTALRIAAEFDYPTVLDEAIEAWRVIDEIAATKSKVLFSSPSAERFAGSGARDGARVRFHTLNLLAAKGIPFAIQTGTHSQALSLIHEAMFAVRNGLDPAIALDAITVMPAQILGIDDRIGSLAPGKDADLVIWSGDPFDPTTRVQAVYIDGAKVQG